MLAVSTSPIIARYLENVPAVAISFWRMAFGALILWIISIFKKQPPLTKINRNKTLLGGFLLGIHFALFFALGTYVFVSKKKAPRRWREGGGTPTNFSPSRALTLICCATPAASLSRRPTLQPSGGQMPPDDTPGRGPRSRETPGSTGPTQPRGPRLSKSRRKD